MRNSLSNSLKNLWTSHLPSGRQVLRLLVIPLILVTAMGSAWGARPIKAAMTADQWTTKGGFEFVQHKGLNSLELKPADRALHIPTATAILTGVTFGNGTIEFDVDPGAMGAGIGFRLRDQDTYEDFYLRPKANCSQAPDCMQYAPQTRGVLLWDLFPQYQSPAPLREGDWNHVKLVVSGRRMNVFINGAKSPTLKIGRLEGDTMEGGVMLQGPGFFANLQITPDAVDGLPAEAEADPTTADHRYIRHWQIAPSSTIPGNQQPSYGDLPAPTFAWHPLAAERGGLVNVSREYGKPPDRSVVWLKTTVHSRVAQSKQVAIGWVREVQVFVNGKPIYADKNLYQPPAARKMPDGRCSLENGTFSLPLIAGDNEVAVALVNNFYGWALKMRFDEVEGVVLDPK